jgi:hypothetical protein
MPVQYNPQTIDFSALAGIGQNIGGALGQHNLGTAMQDAMTNGVYDYDKMISVLAGRRPLAAAELATEKLKADALAQYRRDSLAPEPMQPTPEMRNAEHFGNMPEGDPRRAYGPRTNAQNLTTVDKKEIYTSEDDVTNLDNTIQQLDAALDLNDKTLEGYGASYMASYGSKAPSWAVPDRLEAPAKATLEWQKLMEPEAIKTMASTLKGATTDFELNKFVQQLADPATPRKTRENIIKRMKTLAERKKALANERIQELRGGTYFRPGGGLSDGTPTAPAPVGVKTMSVSPDGSMTPTTPQPETPELQAEMAGGGYGKQPKKATQQDLDRLNAAIKRRPDQQEKIERAFDEYIGEKGSADFYLRGSR